MFYSISAEYTSSGHIQTHPYTLQRMRCQPQLPTFDEQSQIVKWSTACHIDAVHQIDGHIIERNQRGYVRQCSGIGFAQKSARGRTEESLQKRTMFGRPGGHAKGDTVQV